MLLLNAVYYKDNWNYIFDRFQTKKEMFNGTKTVDMMHQTFEDVNFYQNSIVQIIELPFANSQVSTIIMLPAKDIDINDYASSINSRINFLLKKGFKSSFKNGFISCKVLNTKI